MPEIDLYLFDKLCCDKKILFNLLLKEISGTSFPRSISKQISIKMKNPEPLRYCVCHQLFYLIFFTFINEEFFNSSYYSYKVCHPSLCKISFHP